MHHTLLQASDAVLNPVGPIVLGGLRKLLLQYQDADPTDPRANDMKANAYTCIGLLGKRIPTLFADGTGMSLSLIHSLSLFLIRVSIQYTHNARLLILSHLVNVFRNG
jgi:hypothetical protein